MANEKLQNLRLFGNQTIDYTHIVDGVASDDFINGTYVANYIPLWTTTPQTLLLAQFSYNSTEAGNVGVIPGGIETFKIFRSENNILSLVAEVDATVLSLTDYAVQNQGTFQYYVFPETSDAIGSPVLSNVVQSNWWNWSLISYDETDQDGVFVANEVWTFDIDVSSAPIVQNLDRHTYVNFTQYPKVSIGNNNYVTSSFSARIGDVNCITGQYDNDTSDTRRRFFEFVGSGKPYLVKDRKGIVVPGQILQHSFDTLDASREQVTRVNISIVQLGNINDISVINPEALEV